MESIHIHELIFLLLYLVLPFLIIGWRNRFDNWKKTFGRFWRSVMYLWFYRIAGACILYYIDVYYIGGQARAEMLRHGHRGIMIAVMTGWIPGFLLSLAAWMLMRLPIALWRLGRELVQGINISSTKTNSSDSTAM